MKEFNVTGTCIPDEHYMVDISKKIKQITELIKKRKYFTINRARQYGKTTTLAALFRHLKEEYLVLRLSFEGVGSGTFGNDGMFVNYFIHQIGRFMDVLGEDKDLVQKWLDTEETVMDPFELLSKKITGLCKSSKKEVILMIDEVDKNSDDQVFLNFLGMLRNKFLMRAEGLDVTFQSVILAGVYDIRNLKRKVRANEEHKFNSPWNIAVDFKVDMSFSPKEIATMLNEYEKEHHTGMNIEAISESLYFYTDGYPFLVSSLCKWIDEEGKKDWSIKNIQAAEKSLLKAGNTLFDDMIKNIENHKELKKLVTDILYAGEKIVYNIANPDIAFGVMLGIFSEKNNLVAISNIIFETYLYDYVISIHNTMFATVDSVQNMFVQNGRLDMPLILDKFQELMKAEYRREDAVFLEKQGRLLFLCFLKPIINGTGFYYVEPETRSSNRMDIVVTYGGEEFIIELKLWRGARYRKDAIRQLEGYMESRNSKRGYLVSFSFLKNKKYARGYLKKEESENEIYEVVV